MRGEGDFYRRRLPHIVPAGATFFVTFRLAGSIPAEVLQRWAEEDRVLEAARASDGDVGASGRRRQAGQRRFREMEACLDAAASGPRWLEREDVAEVVVTAFGWVQEHKADVDAYCVMPNHVHALLTPQAGDGPYVLADILRSLKGYTAWESNRRLGRSGPFWQHESYDHYVRDAREHERIVDYMLANPVRAGLAEEPGAWPWSFAR